MLRYNLSFNLQPLIINHNGNEKQTNTMNILILLTFRGIKRKKRFFFKKNKTLIIILL